MPPPPAPLPTRFPCWCRAVYSWGGESKRDLGFIEGDLIECLNAGDGSWWVGRLYRDRRTVGSFPSNFVELLPPQFRPTTRSVSPLPPANSTPSTAIPQKSRTFRKPFEAYAKAPHYTAAKTPETFKEPPKPSRSRENSHSSRNPSPRRPSPHVPSPHVPSPHVPSPRDPSSRNPSPRVSVEQRASPALSHRAYGSRGPSPVPSPGPLVPSGPPVIPATSFNRNSSYRSPERADSPPPPPPPPHRHVTRAGSRDMQPSPIDISRHGSTASFTPVPYDISRHGSNASFNPPSRQNSNVSYRPHTPHTPHHHSRQNSYSSFDDRNYIPYSPQVAATTPRAASPMPPSPAGSHMTPSPLREAMDGVMEQLGQLGGFGEAPKKPESPEPPLDPWSPESFDMVPGRSKRKDKRSRPLTSIGIANLDEGYETWSGGSSTQDPGYQSSYSGKDLHQQKQQQPLPPPPPQQDGPHLSNYVERMERRFQKMHQHSQSMSAVDQNEMPPPPPPKNQPYERPKSSMAIDPPSSPERKVRPRKSAYDVGRGVARTFTTKTNATNQSNTSSSTQSSSRTLWSGQSASGFSQTSAGSLARAHHRTQSAFGIRDELDRPETPFTGVTYHSSHASNVSPSRPQVQAASSYHDDGTAGLGGLVQPKAPKRNIFRKILDSAKTGVASTRVGIGPGGNSEGMKSAPTFGGRSQTARSSMPTGFGNSSFVRDTMSDMGMGGGSGGTDWVQVRRDINRSNSLSKIERTERQERCYMMDHPTLNPVDELYESVEGDEGVDGEPVHDPVNYQSINLSQVDKNSRFISSLPPMITAISLATNYICRPYRSDVQRLRGIFTWITERIAWEEDFEGEIDTRHVIQSKRACAEEYSVLVMEMCQAIGIHCEIVRGYLKAPGDAPDLNIVPRANHWWNVIVIDNEWRFIDCCLASPSNPRRPLYSSTNSTTADFFWFLARPLELCWTHIPDHHGQQHIVPPVAHETLLHLPCACPSFFRTGIEMVDYNTALTRIEDLEMVHVKFNVPADIEIAAEVEVHAYSRDSDGDVFESGELVKKRALAQAEWYNGVKRYTIKALLPGDEGQGTLKIYAGKRGLMHSIKDIPHPLAFSLPIIHTGENPPYDFVTRHPTPHAQRHDIYVVQPQCQRLALNNTFVFAIRQHPSSLTNGLQSTLTPSSNPGGTSPIPFARPASAMSIGASSTGGSNPSCASGTVAGKKPAKLAIQTPGGKILRLMRKEDRKGISAGSRGIGPEEDASDGGTWETIIKCSEKGVWRGLVLADRTARWCVFAEWTCMG